MKKRVNTVNQSLILVASVILAMLILVLSSTFYSADQAVVGKAIGNSCVEEWQQQSSTVETLKSVDFVNPNTGWAVGVNGAILKTTDRGSTWVLQRRETVAGSFGLALQDVNFVDANTGWVTISNSLLKTTDGGSSWQFQSTGYFNYLLAINFVNSNIGWVVGDNGIILKTTNGGSSWQAQSSGTTVDLNAIDFVDSNIGWVVGDNGVVLKTTNGGSSWQTQSSGRIVNFNGANFISSTTGWIVGDNGVILRTTNGGSSWQTQSSGAMVDLNEVNFVNSNIGWVVGDNGIILKTTNGGSSWQTQLSGTTSDLAGIDFIDFSTGWVIGGNKVYKYQVTCPAECTLDSDCSFGERCVNNFCQVQVACSLISCPNGCAEDGSCLIGDGETCGAGDVCVSGLGQCILGSCADTVCGDNIKAYTEECDGTSGCSASCTLEPTLCGNGRNDFGEQCDDGNTFSGDGCSSSCQVESGFTCGGSPYGCNPTCTTCTNNDVCGNQNIFYSDFFGSAETCDDGNTVSGDGCSSTCTVENDWTCANAFPDLSCKPIGAICGDANLNGNLEISDVLLVIGYLLNPSNTLPAVNVVDVSRNQDGSVNGVNVLDLIAIVNRLSNPGVTLNC